MLIAYTQEEMTLCHIIDALPDGSGKTLAQRDFARAQKKDAVRQSGKAIANLAANFMPWSDFEF